MAIEPYLFFNGCCEEAIKFYKQALGAEVLMTMRYKDSPEPPPHANRALVAAKESVKKIPARFMMDSLSDAA